MRFCSGRLRFAIQIAWWCCARQWKARTGRSAIPNNYRHVLRLKNSADHD